MSVGLICVLVTMACQAMSQEPTMSMTSSSTVIIERQTLKLTCSLNVGIGNTGNLWRPSGTSVYGIQKKQDEASGWLDLNKHKNKGNHFTGDGNINPDVNDNNGAGGTFITTTEISILNMRQSDAGFYRCLYKPTEDVTLNSSTVEIVVKTHPYNLTFDVASTEGNLTKIESDQSGVQIYEANPDHRVNLTCVNMGGEPDSTIVIRVGDGESSPKAVRVKHAWVGHKTGYKVWKRQVSTSIVEPDISKMNGKMAVCESRYGGTLYLQEKIEFRLRLPPSIVCDKSIVLAKLGKSAKLTCDVKGHFDQIWWVMVQGKSENILKPGDRFSGRFYVKETEKHSDDLAAFRSTLEIDNIKPDDFNSYTLHVESKYGNGKKRIVLQRDNTGELTDGSSQLTFNLATLATLCVISLLANKE